MNQVMDGIENSSMMRVYRSFSPAARAALLFAVPFTVFDALHYYTAGTALIFSAPLLIVVYMLCGAHAAKLARRAGASDHSWAAAGRSAGVRLWLISTTINTLVSLLLGFASLGRALASGAFYLCLFAPFHLVGSALAGWLGGWLYRQVALRAAG